MCHEIGQHPADVAIAWVASNVDVTSPIIGPRTSKQLDGALTALEIKLDEEFLDRLNVLFPGPGGEAPEAYAW